MEIQKKSTYNIADRRKAYFLFGLKLFDGFKGWIQKQRNQNSTHSVSGGNHKQKPKGLKGKRPGIGYVKGVGNRMFKSAENKCRYAKKNGYGILFSLKYVNTYENENPAKYTVYKNTGKRLCKL